MPAKTKHKRAFHRGHNKERHTKRFLKAYAPYLPLLVIVGFGLFISTTSNFKRLNSNVLSYATNMTDDGLLDATNAARAENGLKPLSHNSVLDKAAQAKAEDMAARNYWAHNTPDGKEPWIFIDQAGYRYYKAAENLAYGFDNSAGAVVGWMNSPSHRANILDNDLKEVGFGVINMPNYQGKGPETIVVAMYGSPAVQLGAGTGNEAPATPNTLASAAPRIEKKISYAQMLTGGAAPWISFATGLLIGLISMYLLLKHARNLGRVLRGSERFILHHPLLDTTLVALLALATVVAQTAGVIH
jgi:hypothetical protein